MFYEITESAVKEGVSHPRNISMPLVNAQQARRALDHLVGFNLSPLLWKKIGPSLSAGRVQSPALRLLVEREQEIESFKTREYWTVHLESHKAKDKFSARLTQYKGEKVEQFTITTDTQQQAVVSKPQKTAKGRGTVIKVEQAQASLHRHLSLRALQAGSRAQARYDGAACHAHRARTLRRVDIGGGTVGLITYMRTDSTNLAKKALHGSEDYIAKHFSADYCAQERRCNTAANPRMRRKKGYDRPP